MTTLEELDDTLQAGSPVPVEPLGDDAGQSTAKVWLGRIAFGAIAVLVLLLLATQSKARATAGLAGGAVVVTGGLWIGANLVFNQAAKNWQLFNALRYGIGGFIIAGIIAGNGAINGASEGTGVIGRLTGFIWFPLIIAAVTAATGWALGRIDAPTTRLAIGAGGMGAAGLIIGAMMDSSARPDNDAVALIGWTALVAGIGAGISFLRKQPPTGGALLGAAIGWILGAFGAPDIGDGAAGWAIVACTIPAAAFGLRFAMKPIGGVVEHAQVDRRARPVIFLAPALLFVTVTLVIPAIRTFLISLKDRKSEEFVGIDNYTDTFSDTNSWDMSGWNDMFFNWPMRIGLLLLIMFAVIGTRMKQRTGRLVELGSPSMGPLIAGLLFVAFGVFTTLRGTIINNLWWVVVVTIFSTALGLAVAVLADDVKFERVAKSMIFMPMAISLVGASVIWRFMYVARDSSKEQTGVLNAMWVGLGRLSTGQSVAATVFVFAIGLTGLSVLLRAIAGRKYVMALVAIIATPLLVLGVDAAWEALSGDLQRFLIGAILTLTFLALLAYAAKAIARGDFGPAIVPTIAVILLGWFLVRYWGIVGGGVGGQKTNSNGEIVGDPINFIQSSPYNNVFLMIVLIWIQTGFAMVILSAAIKAVPEDVIEAASVDGATSSQIFWRVTLPQIAPTIGVVVTTIIVLVMKVFDIVKVMTNGNFGTQVLANDMYFQAFTSQNFGRGAALAMLIFFSVMPIMVFNIRQMQKEN